MTCREILQNYINNHQGYIKKVHLYAVAEEWDAETVARELRALEEEGLIKGDYYNGTRRKVKLKMYAKKDYQKPRITYVEVDGVMKAVMN